MTIGGVPPLINKQWFINPGLTVVVFPLNQQTLKAYKKLTHSYKFTTLTYVNVIFCMVDTPLVIHRGWKSHHLVR